MTERYERIKKEFWSKYTELYNQNPDAFKLMLELGQKQGKRLGKQKTLKQVQDIIEKMEFKFLNDVHYNAEPFVWDGKEGYNFVISTDDLKELKQKLGEI